MMRDRLITLAFLAAAGLTAFGGWLAYPPFGFALAGVFLFIIAWYEGTVERDVRKEIR
jgi:hypothetical protein